jgi:ubiquinone/menaquinone biosynthesis C-methylase UbiE
MTEAIKQRAWEHYWQSSRLASCGGEGGQQYQAAIVEHWHRVFANFHGVDRLLDLCCGNGALSVLANRYFREQGLESVAITGIDRAPINPHRWLARLTPWVTPIRFEGGVSAESLPFPEGSFSAVIGQYAIEYTDRDRSLAECRRVLADSGYLAFVCHAREGRTVERANTQLADIERLRQLDYFSSARVLARLRFSHPDPRHPDCLNAKTLFDEKSRILQDWASRSAEPAMYENVVNVTRDTLGKSSHHLPEVIQAKLDEVEAGVEDHAHRVQALVEAALTETEIRSWLDPLVRRDFRAVGCLPHPVRGPRGLLGWSVVLRRGH